MSNWIAACDRILELAPQAIVPGHGPPSTTEQVAELKAYFEYLYEQARVAHGEGMSALQAARSLPLGRWAPWGEREPLNPLLAFQQMAELARESGG